MRATLKQLAERTGLSISTVSRVVTGKGYVSGESRKMVEEAVKALDYVPQERRPVSLKDHDNLVMIMIGGIRSTLCSALLETLVQELEKSISSLLWRLLLFLRNGNVTICVLRQKTTFLV